MLREDPGEYDYGYSSEKSSEKSSENFALTDTKKQIMGLIREDNSLSAAAIAKKISLTSRAVEKNIRQLREDGYLLRVGAARGGYWLILKNL